MCCWTPAATLRLSDAGSASSTAFLPALTLKLPSQQPHFRLSFNMDSNPNRRGELLPDHSGDSLSSAGSAPSTFLTPDIKAALMPALSSQGSHSCLQLNLNLISTGGVSCCRTTVETLLSNSTGSASSTSMTAGS